MRSITKAYVRAAQSGQLDKYFTDQPQVKSESPKQPRRQTNANGKPVGIYKITQREAICIALAKADTQALHNLLPDLTDEQITCMIEAT